MKLKSLEQCLDAAQPDTIGGRVAWTTLDVALLKHGCFIRILYDYHMGLSMWRNVSILNIYIYIHIYIHMISI